jgi:superfamily II RNA helicase
MLQRYFYLLNQVKTVQEELWRSFLHHFRFLQKEGYVSQEGMLTHEGLWASKLRLDQPLLISECIRKGVFPNDRPALLAGLVAPFVSDRERALEKDTVALAYAFEDLAKHFFDMQQSLQRLRQNLEADGFFRPPLSFLPMVTIYHWAQGTSWEDIREISGMDEGDLAMLVFRTADHLRQIESLKDTHPQLAATARQAVTSIMREPVVVD